MPQPFKNAVMTNKGAELLSKAQAGQVKLEFTRMVTGSGSYQEAEKTDEALQEATGLKEERQGFAPSSVSVYTPRSVLIKALITNYPVGGPELTEGYYINEIGLFAKEKDGGSDTEVLYSISVTTGIKGDFMPPYNGYSPAEIIQEYYATVSNSAEVTIVRGLGAAALAEDLDAANQRISELAEKIKGTSVIPFDRGERIGKEITLSWTEIKEKVEAGDFSYFQIGDYKAVTTIDGGDTFVMEIAGINLYTSQEAGGPYHQYHIDFISRDCLQGGMQFGQIKPYDSFKDTAMYLFLNEQAVYPRLPEELQRVLSEKVFVAGYTGFNSGLYDKVIERIRIWLPTETEVFGYRSYSMASCGITCGLQYPLFQLGTRSIIKGEFNGATTGTDYWLISPAAAKYDFPIQNDARPMQCCVFDCGMPGWGDATRVIGVPICFTIAKEWS